MPRNARIYSTYPRRWRLQEVTSRICEHCNSINYYSIDSDWIEDKGGIDGICEVCGKQIIIIHPEIKIKEDPA